MQRCDHELNRNSNLPIEILSYMVKFCKMKVKFSNLNFYVSIEVKKNLDLVWCGSRTGSARAFGTGAGIAPPNEGTRRSTSSLGCAEPEPFWRPDRSAKNWLHPSAANRAHRSAMVYIFVGRAGVLNILKLV